MTIAPGSLAPEIDLPTVDGSRVRLSEVRDGRSALVAFVKVGCPACDHLLPSLATVQRRYGDHVPSLVVAQDAAEPVGRMLRAAGVGGVAAIDAPDYVASIAYGLEAVPTLVLIDGGGRVEDVAVGWDRQRVEALGARIAGLAGAAPAPLSSAADGAPPFRPG